MNTELKLISFNIHKGLSPLNARPIVEEIRAGLRECDPDLVLLQEVSGKNDQNAAKHGEAWPNLSQQNYLAESTWPFVAYGPNAVYDHGHHGNAILSKFPLNHIQNHDISANWVEQRGALHTHIQVGSRRVHFICVHLALLEMWRIKQYLGIEALIQQIPREEAVILAGDFNDWRKKSWDRFMESLGMEEVFHRLHKRLPASFPARMPILSLDRIFIRHVECTEATVLDDARWTHLSDHLPLQVKLRLK